MVEFGKQLRESIQGSHWQAEYLDYKKLKKILKPQSNQKVCHSSPNFGTLELSQQQQQQQTKLDATTSTQNNDTELHVVLEFQQVLDQEIEKVVLFLLQEQGRIAGELSRLGLQRDALAQQATSLLKEFRERQELEELKRSLLRDDYLSSSSSLESPSKSKSPSKSSSSSSLDDNGGGTITAPPLLELLGTNHEGYQRVARSVLEFVAYVEMNVTAVRKILKKHDKLYPRQKLGTSYLSKYLFTRHQVDSHLDQLYHYGGVSALAVTLKRAFSELYSMELALVWMQQEQPVSSSSSSSHHPNNNNNSHQPNYHSADNNNGSEHRRTRSLPLFQDALLEGEDTTTTTNNNNIHDNNKNKKTESESSGKVFDADHHPGRGAFVTYLLEHQITLPPPDVAGTTATTTITITCPNEPLLERIHRARGRLEQSTNYVQVIAAQSAMFFDDFDTGVDSTREDMRKQDRAMTDAQRISSFLNLLSTFLYMTNYYIVAPTCGTYATKLGSTEAMAGIIIGMTPNAALIATVLYGWWSNYSYKSAIIFAAGSSMIGNVFYAVALQQDSLTLVMVGRFFNGFGSARSINRRFIADTFSRSDRTAASAAFVTAGALGMAAGPAIAAIVAHFLVAEIESSGAAGTTTVDENLLWTTETAPGWIMLGLWSVFFVSAMFFFEEPDRSHLFGPETTTAALTTGTIELPETKPLLGNNNNNKTQQHMNSVVSTESAHSFKTSEVGYRKVPVLLTLWLYFVLKLVLESLSSSCATLTSYYFDWDSKATGIFLAFLGLLMFPANMVVARLSHRYEDREIIYVTLMVMLFSVLGIIAYRPDNYSVYQYVIFGVCMFTSTNILEGPNMSLLSKTIPKSWAKGIFNSGFLATEAGTLARSIGDVMISAAAALVGTANLLNATFWPPLVLVFISLLLVREYFDEMIEDDEDDDCSRRSAEKQSSFNDD
jgi:hypothetical protein